MQILEFIMNVAHALRECFIILRLFKLTFVWHIGGEFEYAIKRSRSTIETVTWNALLSARHFETL